MAMVLRCAYGPEHWVTSSVSCRGRHQSPIDILDQHARVGEEYQELQLDGFDNESSNKTWMKNTGKTDHLNLTPCKIWRMSCKECYECQVVGQPYQFRRKLIPYLRCYLTRTLPWPFAQPGMSLHHAEPQTLGESGESCGFFSRTITFLTSTPVHEDIIHIVVIMNFIRSNRKTPFGFETHSVFLSSHLFHTVAILLKDDYFVSGAGLPGRFKAEKVEFHWGHSNGSAGSEHSINGRRYPVEVRESQDPNM
ncbi:hypothetical protein P7K49_030904 [Saguinus oedipus]|uniref:Alpha-carbonic anhydrase domain-containing protein n=1 Tax=Saguinus oedipus TaxID=9490 RepID=A0ABQ9U4B0_SAGOE|nr:hypothetical protein P7K49_030904 [Saguinus oedipus]